MSPQVTRQAGKNKGSYVLWLWGPVVGYCALIFLVSAQSDLSLPDFPGSNSDKVAHVLEYGILGILWARAAKTSWPHWTFLLVLASISLFTGLYGVIDEWHQLYVSGRSADWHDALADLCGGTLGGLGYLIGVQVLRRRTMVDLTSMDQRRGLSSSGIGD
jgi:VanZ family protein